jgi:hypothetical protein
MGSRGFGEDGGLSDVPWASIFDPTINVRALGEIQARGFHAASELVDRFVRVSTPEPTASTTDATAPVADETSSATPSGATISEVERLLGSWKGMVGQLVGSLRNGTSESTQGGPAAFDLVNHHATGEIALLATEPGAVSTEVWLHNAGAIDLGKVRLRCSDLLSHDGSVIESVMVRFEPDTVPMPARCSRGVTVEVDVAVDVAPGAYRGTLLADGHPEVWLPMLLTVASQVA